MKILTTAVMIFMSAVFLCGCQVQTKEKQLEKFIITHVRKVKPMAKGVHLACWRAATTGDSADYDEAGELEFKIRQVYADREEFARLKEIKESGEVKRRLLARQLEKLYNLGFPIYHYLYYNIYAAEPLFQ